MIPTVTPAVSVCVCLCRYGWKRNDALCCWGLWVCVYFVCSQWYFLLLNKSHYDCHKCFFFWPQNLKHTWKRTTPPPQFHPDTRLLRQEREGKKERKKRGRERSSLSDAFFLPWGGQWSVSEERKRNYFPQFRHHSNRGQKSLWSEWTSVCTALSWCGFGSAVSMFPVKQPWLCKALGDLRRIIFSHMLGTAEIHSWAFWGLLFVWLLLVKLLYLYIYIKKKSFTDVA